MNFMSAYAYRHDPNSSKIGLSNSRALRKHQEEVKESGRALNPYD